MRSSLVACSPNEGATWTFHGVSCLPGSSVQRPAVRPASLTRLWNSRNRRRKSGSRIGSSRLAPRRHADTSTNTNTGVQTTVPGRQGHNVHVTEPSRDTSYYRPGLDRLDFVQADSIQLASSHGHAGLTDRTAPRRPFTGPAALLQFTAGFASPDLCSLQVNGPGSLRLACGPRHPCQP